MVRQRRHDTASSAVHYAATGAIAGLAPGLLQLDSALMFGMGNSGSAMFVPLGFVAGSIVWLWRVQKERHERHISALRLLKPKRRSRRERPVHEPAPFSQRLAHFTGKSESELTGNREPATSKMPFWSLVDLRSWHGPKSTKLIRYYLQRIRDAVRGTNSRYR